MPANASANPAPLQTQDAQFVVANQLRFAYDEFGNAADPAVILIMGLGQQMIAWSELFCRQIAEQGYRVIRFDNRDVGLSEKIKSRIKISMPKLLLRSRLGLSVTVPYTLDDMATDTVGILDALNIDKAHFVGASMGGMIAQLIASSYPNRCHSLTSIMSTSGNPDLPAASWRITRLLMNRPSIATESNIVEHGRKVIAAIGSPDFPPQADELTERLRERFQRSFYPKGYRHHMAAIIHGSDRRKLLQQLSLPSLVIHGKCDPLVPVECGIDTARNIPGATLKILEGMGHDLPKELVPRMARLIGKHAATA